MKKSLSIVLALVFVLGIAGTAFAANPFADVPAKHWSYNALGQLAKAGIIDGYDDGTFRGDKTMTRYEMAQIVGKAVYRSDKADAANKALIEKLSAEFSEELNNLGVRVGKLEKKVNNLGTMKIGGELRFRYDYAGDGVQGFDAANSDKRRNGQVRYRLNMSANLDDNWKMAARYESSAPKFGGSGSDNTNNLTRAYIEGDVSGMHVLAGRGNFKTFNAYTGWDKDNWDGMGVTIGNKLTLDLYAMKYGGVNSATSYATDLKTGKTTASTDFSQKNTWFKLVQMKYAFSPNFTMAAQWLKNPDQDRIGSASKVSVNGSNYDTIGIGFKYSGWNNLVFGAEYAKNRATRIFEGKVATNDQPIGYEIKLDWNKADKQKVGSWGTWVGYRYAEEGFDRGDMTTGFRHDNAKAARMNNIKGMEVGFDYTFIKNTKFEAFYIDGKPVNGNDYKTPDSDNRHMAYAQMEVFF